MMHNSPGSTHECVNVVGTSSAKGNRKGHSETAGEERVERKNTDKQLEMRKPKLD